MCIWVGINHRISIIRVIQEGREERDTEAIENSILNFDALKCDCSSHDDKAKLLIIILTAFGDMDSFNSALRSMIHQAGFERESVDVPAGSSED